MIGVNNLKHDITSIRKLVNKRLSEFDVARMRYREESEALEIAEQKVEDVLEAQGMAQQVAQTIQQHANNQIAGVVTRCLQAVFDEPYIFHIDFERKRGRTEARLYFEKDGHELDPMSASGGGCVDIASFALRLSCLALSRPSLRRLIVMDEPFKFISVEYRDNVRVLLQTLAKEMKFQFILVTHDDEFHIGKVIRLIKGE